jgi:hypothetical protein
MDFSFGIITDGTSDSRLLHIVKSIQNLCIPSFEIIVVGNSEINLIYPQVNVIPFDETIKKGWITRKKNLITENAKYENIVYSHDYVDFLPDWYIGYKLHGNEFHVCMNRIQNLDGSRYTDWVVWPHNNNFMDSIVLPNRECLIPYAIKHLTKYMYVSGTYWVAKRSFMNQFPLNEELVWGEGEDGDWSFRVREVINLSMNQNSTVKFLKQKFKHFNESSAKVNQLLLNIKSQ